VAVELQQQMFAYEEVERARLAKTRSVPVPVVACLDENFHAQPCLVAIEPVSNFLLLETHAPDRASATWAEHLRPALQAHSAVLVAGTGDEGTGLKAALTDHLDVPHHGDLFHVQHDVVAATAAPMAARLRRAQEAADKAERQVARGVVEPQVAQQAHDKVAQLEAQNQRLRDRVTDLGADYHPFDLQTGEARSAAQVKKELSETLGEIQAVAQAENLSTASLERLQKAERASKSLVERVAWFHQQVAEWVGQTGWSETWQALLLTVLIPACYAHQAARRTKPGAWRDELRERATQRWNDLQTQSTWAGASALEREAMLAFAQRCAALFQRSSSCVEGRNGYLALRHHSLRAIPPGRLRMLTILHNYVVKRPDGTTAAERFFGHPPTDLFAWLLDRVGFPCRPASRRPYRTSFGGWAA
jgi:molecular chaperone GrpE (heat shock protein)